MFAYLFFFFYKFIYLFLYFWLCWVFVSVRGLFLVAASGVHSSSRCAGLSLSRPLLLQSTGSRRAGSVIVAHRPSCSAACGIFPDQGSNPCPLHWQADSQPLHHQWSPCLHILLQFNKQWKHKPKIFLKITCRGREYGLTRLLWMYLLYLTVETCDCIMYHTKELNQGGKNI